MSMTEIWSPARKIHSGGQIIVKICESHMSAKKQYISTYEKC